MLSSHGSSPRKVAIYRVSRDTIYRVRAQGKGRRVGRWEADRTRRGRPFPPRTPRDGTPPDDQENIMSKRGRKRRSRKGNGANHGKRPNA